MSPFIPELDTIDENAPLVYFTYEEVEVNDTNSKNPHRRNSFERLRQRLPKVDDLIDSIISVNTQVVKFLIKSSAISGDPTHQEQPVQISQPCEQSISASTFSQPAFSTSSYSSSSSDSSWSFEDIEYWLQSMGQNEYQGLTKVHYKKQGATRETSETTSQRREKKKTRKSSFEYPHF